jgi:hypothetical protein
VSAAAQPQHPGVERWQRLALIVGAVALAVAALAALGYRVAFFRAYLVAFTVVVGVPLGCLVLLMLQYVTGGQWGFVLRRPFEAATRTLPVVALMYLPLALDLVLSGPDALYAWSDAGRVDDDEHLQHLSVYLNPAFAIGRTAVCFAVWIVLAMLLNRWSRTHDETGDHALIERCESLSAPGMALYAVTVTIVAIDWVMSLEPRWFSTIYGAMFGMGQVLAGFVFAVAVFLMLGTRPPLDRVVQDRGNLRDHGSLLLAFVMVWAYLSFSQFLLIWSANLPEEVPWYLTRLAPGWRVVALSLLLLHFVLPFVLLLSADLKRDRRGLAAVALLVLAMRVVDVVWLIVPAFHGEGGDGLGVLLYPLCLVGLAGLWLSAYLWQLRQKPLLPVHAPPTEAEEPHHG